MDAIKDFFINLGKILLHTVIAFILMIVVIMVPEIEDDTGTIFAMLQLFVLPIVTLLLAWAITLDYECDSNFSSNFSTVLKFISMVLSMLISVLGLIFFALYHNEVKDLDIFKTAIALMWPLTYVLLFYAFDKFFLEGGCIFLAVPVTAGISFLFNLLIAFIGTKIGAFFYTWFPLILYLIGYVVLFYIRKRDGSIVHKVYFNPVALNAVLVSGKREIKVTHNSNIKHFPVFKLEDHVFSKWAIDKEGTCDWEKPYAVKESTTLYAIWKQGLQIHDISYSEKFEESCNIEKAKEDLNKLRKDIRDFFNDETESLPFARSTWIFNEFGKRPKIVIDGNTIKISNLHYYFDWDPESDPTITPQSYVGLLDDSINYTVTSKIENIIKSYDFSKDFEVKCGYIQRHDINKK